ncbi:MAG: hypothetical protein NVSMB53_17020 [Gemmatimonadaceae bacterium]
MVMPAPPGEDKPQQYPTIFNGADTVVITKVDLSAAAGVSWELAERNIQSVRPGIEKLRTAAKTGEGMGKYVACLETRLAGMPAAAP